MVTLKSKSGKWALYGDVNAQIVICGHSHAASILEATTLFKAQSKIEPEFAVCYAAEKGLPQTMEFLMQSAVHTDAIRSISARTAPGLNLFHYAAVSRNVEVVELLVSFFPRNNAGLAQLNSAVNHVHLRELCKQLLLSVSYVRPIVAVRFTIEPVTSLRDASNPRALRNGAPNDRELNHLSAAL